MKIEYDETTKEWCEQHPDVAFTGTCCEVCGLGYNTGLEHKCRGYYAGENKELLRQLGMKQKMEG